MSRKKFPFDELPELRIRGVKPKYIEQLTNISSHLDMSVSELVRKNLLTIINSYPQEFRDHPAKD